MPGPVSTGGGRGAAAEGDVEGDVEGVPGEEEEGEEEEVSDDADASLPLDDGDPVAEDDLDALPATEVEGVGLAPLSAGGAALRLAAAAPDGDGDAAAPRLAGAAADPARDSPPPLPLTATAGGCVSGAGGALGGSGGGADAGARGAGGGRPDAPPPLPRATTASYTRRILFMPLVHLRDHASSAGHHVGAGVCVYTMTRVGGPPCGASSLTAARTASRTAAQRSAGVA